MEDGEIVRLYWERSEQAIPETEAKYGGYCSAIARNILDSREDAEECVNDTWLKAWNAMPPHRPAVLSTFLGKITRNLSFNRWKRNHADKRGGGLGFRFYEVEAWTYRDVGVREYYTVVMGAFTEEQLAGFPASPDYGYAFHFVHNGNGSSVRVNESDLITDFESHLI